VHLTAPKVPPAIAGEDPEARCSFSLNLLSGGALQSAYSEWLFDLNAAFSQLIALSAGPM
jgi:hypothetical protein